MAVHPLNVLSLCSGVGGLDIGFGLAFPGARTVCWVEREVYAAEVLAARMREGALDEAPVWTDLLTFDGKPWRGVVDCVLAGFPCQPWSKAGKQRGTADERWLWPAIARIVGDVGAWLVGLENVPGLVLGGGLEYVLSDLAALGFDAEWGSLSAAEIGAPHKRERVFVLAYRDGNERIAGSGASVGGEDGRHHPGWCRRDDVVDPSRHGGGGRDGEAGDGRGVRGTGDPVADAGSRAGGTEQGEQPGQRADQSGGGVSALGNTNGLGGGQAGVGQAGLPDGRSAALGNADSEGSGGQPDAPLGGQVGGTAADWAGAALGLPDGAGLAGRGVCDGGRANGGTAGQGDGTVGNAASVGWGEGRAGHVMDRGRDAIADASSGDELPLFPPGPGDRDGWRYVLERWPWFAPALSKEEVESGFRGLAPRLAAVLGEHRAEQLRCIGNGVVPLCAGAAFTLLARRLGIAEWLGIGEQP